MPKMKNRLTFGDVAQALRCTTADVRAVVVEEKRLPAIYVTLVGYAEAYNYQLLKVDDEGLAFDLSVGGLEGSVHTGYPRSRGITDVLPCRLIIRMAWPAQNIESAQQTRSLSDTASHPMPAPPVVAASARARHVCPTARPTSPMSMLAADIQSPTCLGHEYMGTTAAPPMPANKL